MTAMDDVFLARSLAAWRADSTRVPRPAAIASARAAMLSAVAAQPRRRLAVLLGLRPRRHRAAVGLTLAGVATGAALTIGAIGWNSPAGSPFHSVRLARERVELAVPGIDIATLKLGFAEDRLADAKAGRDPEESLAEATSLLASVEGSLPDDRTAAVWARWNADEAELAVLEAEENQTPSSPSASPASSPEGGGVPAPAGASSHATARPSGRSGEPSQNGAAPAARTEPPEPSDDVSPRPSGGAVPGSSPPSSTPPPGESPDPSEHEHESSLFPAPSPTPTGFNH